MIEPFTFVIRGCKMMISEDGIILNVKDVSEIYTQKIFWFVQPESRGESGLAGRKIYCLEVILINSKHIRKYFANSYDL